MCVCVTHKLLLRDGCRRTAISFRVEVGGVLILRNKKHIVHAKRKHWRYTMHVLTVRAEEMKSPIDTHFMTISM